MGKLSRGLPGALQAVAVVALLALVAVGGYFLLTGGGTKSGTAYFENAKGIYEGDAVKVLGMEVGKIDTITPEGEKVRVDFHYDSDVTLPADVGAGVLSPTLVSTRFIQLAPAYTDGPVFEDGAVIPIERTAVPLEFDELKKQLAQIAERLGPNGINSDGALNRALTVINKNGVQNGVGQGQAFHDMVVELSKAAKTISDGRGDLFGTVENLAKFSSVLSRYDDQIVEFQRRLADVSANLDANSDALRKAFPIIEDAGKEVARFTRDQNPRLQETIDRAASVSRSLARVRADLAQTLHIAPNALANFSNLFHPRTGQIYGALDISGYAGPGLASPGNHVCALITTAAAANPYQGQKMCADMLSPLFAQLVDRAPPPGSVLPSVPFVPGVTVPHGSTPPYGDIDSPDEGPDTNPSPNGSNSDLPRSETANGESNTYSDPALPIPGLNPSGGN